MVAAFTTAAVVNFSQFAPEKAAAPLSWMPNHRQSGSEDRPARPFTEEEKQEQEAFELRVLALACELRAGLPQRSDAR